MNFLNKTAYRVLLALFSLAFIVMLLEPYSTIGFIEPLSVVLLSIGLFFLFRFLYRWLKNLSKKQLKILIFIGFTIFFVFELLWVNLAHAQLFGDPWHMQTQAVRLSQGSKIWDAWILRYPNLLPMVSLYLSFIKLSQVSHVAYYTIFYGYNILINTTIWGLILHFVWKKSAVSSAFLACLLPFFPMAYGFLVLVGYSDGLAILSLLLLVMIFDRAQEKEQFGIFAFISSSLVFALAFLARPNVVVFIIALLIIAVYGYLLRKKMQSLWKSASKMLIACLLGLLLATAASHSIEKATGFNPKNSNALPSLHWVYMGLNTYNFGEYNPADVAYSENHIGYSTASQADLAGILHRIKSENVFLPVLWLSKFATLWSEGNFQSLTDYQYYSYSYNWTRGPAWLIKNIGAIQIFLGVYSKALVSLLLLSIILRLRRTKRAEVNSFGLMLLVIMGISLFHTFLWEVKPRYQFMTFGLILLSASLNLDQLFESDLKLISPSRKFLKKFVPIASVISLTLMSTLLQIQPEQKVIVTAQQHPVDNYGYNNDTYELKPHETIYQEFGLSVASDTIDWQPGNSGPLKMQIQKNLSNNWSDFDSHVIATDNIPTPQGGNQFFTSNMSAGQYRFAISNPNSYPVSLTLDMDTAYLDYPHLIKLPNGKTASLGFIISSSKTQAKYSFALISLYALLFLVVNLLVFLVK
ncbi:MAG: hypothetical protein LBI13_09570 [Streptococcaceae bacterium]|jgi:hypothetical protein|nr:hypothetical protein [Streptococcaceae bacterium]